MGYDLSYCVNRPYDSYHLTNSLVLCTQPTNLPVAVGKTRKSEVAKKGAKNEKRIINGVHQCRIIYQTIQQDFFILQT